MKKILLPLSLSLLIVLALVFVAMPKKAAELPVVDPVSTPTAQEDTKNLDQLAEEAVKSESGSLESSWALAWTGTSAETSTGSETSSTGALAESGATDGNAMCTDEYAPVCGTDKNTYPNACAANRMKVASIPGACPKEGAMEEGSEPGNPGSGSPSSQPETVALTGSSAMPTATVSGHPYDNTGLGYGFVLPKSSYFSGFGSRDGASHSVGIGRDASPESFELAEVKVRFYKGKILSQLQNAENGFYEDAESGITYLSLNGSTLTVEADRSISGKIVDSIVASAYVR